MASLPSPNCTSYGFDRMNNPECKSSIVTPVEYAYFAYYDFMQAPAFFQSQVLNQGSWNISKGSLNPDIALRSSFHSVCNFHPLMEHHASRWGPYSSAIYKPYAEFPGML